MKLAIFGLSITSSWGNGHATLWRGLLRALARRGHHITFFEKDVPWYASHRDLLDLPGVDLLLYSEWRDICRDAASRVAACDAAIITSYCPDAQSATDVLNESPAARIFYDLDAPVTLHRLACGETVEYVPDRGYADFDLVMSYTGGRALEQLRLRLGARHAVPIYGSVDPEIHFPVPPSERWRGDLSYLGTFAKDRQEALARLFVEPARRRPGLRFVMGGAMYGNNFPWTANIFFHPHVPPADHSSFYCSSKATLNVTRFAMAEYGWCPSGRLFEAAACGAPVITDTWDGLDQFFKPGEEIVTAQSPEDVLDALDQPELLAANARRARERTLDQHTAAHRALDFEEALQTTMNHSTPVAAGAGL